MFKKLSTINGFVHPYNSFQNIRTEYNSLGEINIDIIKTYTEEDIVVTITYKAKEIPVDPDPHEDPAPTPTPEPEPQPTPQPEEKTVDTSDINVWMYLTIALGTTVVIVRETKKALNK